MEIHWMLSIFITSYALMAMKVAIKNVALVVSNKTIWTIFTMPQPRVSKPMFFGHIFYFQHLKQGLEAFIMVHSLQMARMW
jgi:hypothetical protein